MRFTQTRSILLVVLLIGSVLAGPGMTAAASSTVHDLNFGASATQNPEIPVDVTKSVHQMGWDATEYENDAGDIVKADADINSSVNNTYEFTVTEINASDLHAFPHDKEDVSALDAGEWSTSVSDTTNTALTTSNVETAPGVEAVNIATGGSMGSGDTATATFSNFSVTSDEAKRFLQVGMNVNTLDAGATVEVRAVDEDGDYKTAEVNSTRSSGEDLITNATGNGLFFQRQLGKMTTLSDGDSDGFDNIQSVEVVISDADADVTIAALNVEKMSKYDLGEQKYQADDDDELETKTIREVKTAGPIKIHDLGTMGTTFDNAEFHDLTIPMVFSAEHLSKEMDIKAEFTDAANFPSFEFRIDVYYRLQLPDAYDLSYANAKLTDEVALPGSRYQTVEYAEGVGDTEFSEIQDSSWTSVGSNYDSQGASVTVDNTIQPGQQIAIHYDYTITTAEHDAMLKTGGAAAMGPSSGGGGFFGGIINFFSSLVGQVVGLLGIGAVGFKKFAG